MIWGRKWTNHEVLLVTELRKSGCGFDEIAKRLNRSRVSVRSFLNRNHVTVDRATRHRNMLEASVRRERNKKNYIPAWKVADIVGHVSKVNVPAAVIAERDRRANEYRSLSQILMGDPPPSQSALAQQHARGLIERRESVTD